MNKPATPQNQSHKEWNLIQETLATQTIFEHGAHETLESNTHSLGIFSAIQDSQNYVSINLRVKSRPRVKGLS